MAYMQRCHPTKFLYEFLQAISAHIYIHCSSLVGEEEEDAATYIPPSTSWSASLARWWLFILYLRCHKSFGKYRTIESYAAQHVVASFCHVGNPMQVFQYQQVASLYTSKYIILVVKLHLHRFIHIHWFLTKPSWNIPHVNMCCWLNTSSLKIARGHLNWISRMVWIHKYHITQKFNLLILKYLVFVGKDMAPRALLTTETHEDVLINILCRWPHYYR